MRRLPLLASLLGALSVIPAPALAASDAHFRHVTWMKGFTAPGTPARYNRVGVLKIGAPRARNVLVFEPGTSAGSAYIVPLAVRLVSALPGWQVWSVERRQNLLEDQSVLTLAKEHRATAQQVFDYYLNYLFDPSVTQHLRIPAPSSVAYAKNWGLNVAMQDLHIVVRAARRLGGKVVLSGHSLGGGLVTAYATWDFHGRAGADDLAGLVFDDGGNLGSAVSAAKARQDLANLMAPTSSPWGGVGGASIPTPYLGLFGTTGGLAAVQEPNAPSLAQTFQALPGPLKPPVPVTNLAEFAYGTNASTSTLGDFAAYAHEGKGLASTPVDGVYGWNAAGAITPPQVWAAMMSGPSVLGADGLEWYFPYRLTLDTAESLDNGIDNPAQHVLGVHATMGRRLPHRLLMYAFGAALGRAIDTVTLQLARQSHIPRRNLTLKYRTSYAHNDPAGAFPHNAFFTYLVPFLRTVVRVH
jgi:hypothetical protein